MEATRAAWAASIPTLASALVAGSSLVFIGVGSKREVVTASATAHFSHVDYLTIDCAAVPVPAASIVQAAYYVVFGKAAPPGTSTAALLTSMREWQEVRQPTTAHKADASAAGRGAKPLYSQMRLEHIDKRPILVGIVIHSLDRLLTMDEGAASVLGELASTGLARLIVSLDDSALADRLDLHSTIRRVPAATAAACGPDRRHWEMALGLAAPRLWLLICVSTFQPYVAETAAGRAAAAAAASPAADATASLRHVLRSLTAKATAVLRVLADLSAARGGGSVPFHDLLAVAQRHYLATDATALQGHLREPADHRLVQWDGTSVRLQVRAGDLEAALAANAGIAR